ncbi:MAG TPA: DUF6044 family protein, partial [Candidatus Omnitrophota bacterium]|nr:DUF6044 family protein [Candidatus Omnitrophota bacterium]
WLAQWLPVLSGFNAHRFTVDAPFVLAGGAAWSLHRIVQRTDARRGRWIVGGVLGALALPTLVLQAADARDWLQWGSFAANWQSPALRELARSQSPDDPFRVATIQENGLQSGYTNAYGLEAADGYINLYARGYHRLWQAVIEPYLDRDADKRRYFLENGARVSLYTDDGHALPLPTGDYFRTSLLALLNVRYLVTNVPLAGDGLEIVEHTRPDRWWDELPAGEKIRRRLTENFSGRHMVLYRVTGARPRWWLAETVRAYDGDDRLAQALRTEDAAALARAPLLPAADAVRLGLADGARLGRGTITPAGYGTDAIDLAVDCEDACLLVVANSYSPFWQAEIDGRPAGIGQAYGALWAIRIPGGQHRVAFRYRPPYAFH